MNYCTSNTKILFRQSIILSGLLHCLLITTLIFTFPQRPIPKKPNFLFLGSILSFQDLSTVKTQSGTNTLNYQFIQNTQSTKKPYQEHRVHKAKINGSVIQTNKQTKKLLFTLPEQKQNIEDIGISLEFTPYNPLRLKSHDKN